MITSERRAFRRVREKFTVRYQRVAPSSSAWGVSMSENISVGGVYFVSLEKFAIGEFLECRIFIPGTKAEGRWTARVVRCENESSGMVATFGVAVEFVEGSGNSEKDLKKALNDPGEKDKKPTQA
jgi:hypothetical protein